MLRINKDTQIQSEINNNYTTVEYLNPESLKNAYIEFTYDKDFLKEIESFKWDKRKIKNIINYNSEDIKFMARLLGYVKN